MALLEAAGFSGTEAALALIAVARYTIGSALEQQTARDGGDIILTTTRTDAPAAHLAAIAHHVVTLGPDHEFNTGLAPATD